MSTKHFIGLASLFASAAFAVMPAAAQAAPHWYKSGTIMTSRVPVTGGGTLTFSANLGSIECVSQYKGFVENPFGGAAGVGGITIWTFPVCPKSVCPLGTVAKGEGFGSLPWLSILEESIPGEIRLKIVNLEVEFGCFVGGTPVGHVRFIGTLTPKVKNGTKPNPGSRLEFGVGSGLLTSPTPGWGPGKVTGYVNLMGLAGIVPVLVTAKNP